MATQTSDPERAETYLRLQAETQLRIALGYPRIPPRRERRAPSWLQRARLRHVGAVMAGTAPGPVRRLVRALAPAPLLRALARPPAQPSRAWNAATRWATMHYLRWRHRLRGHREDGQRPGAYQCVERIVSLSGALAAVGAVSEATATQVASDLRTALAARSLIDQPMLIGRWPTMRPPGLALRGPAHGQVPPPGPVRVIPVGVARECTLDGRQIRMYLGSLVTDGTTTEITMQARFEPTAADRYPGRRPMLHQMHQAAAVDDQGGTYQAGFSGGGSPGRWDGTFRLNPQPPATARWLDLTLAGAARPVRIALDTEAGGFPVASQALDPAGAADRFLDARTADQLRHGWPDPGDEPSVVAVAAGLLGAGVLSADSPSLARLAAAAAHHGGRLPRPLDRIQPSSMPADWLSLIARRDAADGPAGVIPVATALPDVDGVTCVVTELLSEPDGALLHVRAHGWPWPSPGDGMRPGEPLRWTARDDTGGLYLCGQNGSSYNGRSGQADLRLQVRPPINPAARELEITLTGRTAQASMTVPLDWRDTA